MMILAAAAAMAVAFFLAATGTVLARRLAVQWDFVNYPKGDRFSRAATPMLGGSAIFLAILMPSLLVLALATSWASGPLPAWAAGAWMDRLSIHVGGAAAKAPMALIVLAGAALLHVVGLVDDKKHLGPWVKLVAQFAVASGVVLLADIRMLTLLGEPASTLGSIFWIVLVTNSFNFLDNVDGLAAGVGAICGCALLGSAAGSGQVFVGGWLCLLIGACAGFLVHNFPPAKVYMGDAGSMVIGYFLAVLSIMTTYYHGGPSGRFFGLFVPLVVLAVPLYDTISVITLRLRDRKNPMVGDTRHFSHRLIRRGMSPRSAVLTIYLATGATAVGASLLPRVDELGAMMVFGQTLAIVLLIALLESAEQR